MNETKLLVVDDDPGDIAITRALLREIEHTRYTLSVASSYDEGLSALETEKPDACLVDFTLGPRDGIAFVRDALARGSQVPMILIADSASGEIDVAAQHAGAVDFLAKGQLTAPLLDRAIRYSIVRRRAEERRLELIRTELARREAEHQSRQKDDFLAVLAHELRTPLNAVLGWAQLLRVGALAGAKVQQAYESIERSARAQAQLVEDLLDVSRIVANKIRVELQPVSLNQIVEHAIDAVRPDAAAKGMSIEMQSDARCRVNGDPARLQQIVWNLLVNAVKYSSEGGSVRVRLSQEGTRAKLSVEDSGRGIDPSELQLIFKRFWQADRGAARTASGLGLGLALVKHLTELHGGSVQAYSAGLGEGATFTVTLPLLAFARTATPRDFRAPVPGRPTPDSELLRGQRVLVVDDDRESRDYLSSALALYGSDVQTAGSAAGALRALREGPFNVIVSDLAMPDADGFELIRAIRADSAYRRLGAIAITGVGGIVERNLALEAGFDAHMQKPVDPNTLAEAVATLIRHAKKEE
jgi:signal transduction histidine kinase